MIAAVAYFPPFLYQRPKASSWSSFFALVPLIQLSVTNIRIWNRFSRNGFGWSVICVFSFVQWSCGCCEPTTVTKLLLNYSLQLLLLNVLLFCFEICNKNRITTSSVVMWSDSSVRVESSRASVSERVWKFEGFQDFTTNGFLKAHSLVNASSTDQSTNNRSVDVNLIIWLIEKAESQSTGH